MQEINVRKQIKQGGKKRKHKNIIYENEWTKIHAMIKGFVKERKMEVKEMRKTNRRKISRTVKMTDYKKLEKIPDIEK